MTRDITVEYCKVEENGDLNFGLFDCNDEFKIAIPVRKYDCELDFYQDLVTLVRNVNSINKYGYIIIGHTSDNRRGLIYIDQEVMDLLRKTKEQNDQK